MATVHVIIAGRSNVTVHDTYDFPLVLQFGSNKDYNLAEWVLPSYRRHIPTWRLSEIRVDEGILSVLVDGPEGFCLGPYLATSVRSYYPRGKHCALIRTDLEVGRMLGVTLTTMEDTLFVEEFPFDPASSIS